MCGIAGLIDLSGRYDIRDTVKLMTDTMIYRGPDGFGEFIETRLGMGMRRLSIIDLDHGWQPFFSPDRMVVAFQNGELYNYRSLKTELSNLGYSFTTESDTEVLPQGYLAWGMDGLLRRLDGMFALAIYDRRTGILHLARDRFGEKPLFYRMSNGTFGFSSNTLALQALGEADISPAGLNYYLAVHYVPGDMTIFRDIFRLLPGERMEVAADSLKLRKYRYYRVPLEKAIVSEEEMAARLEHAVTSRLVADVPVGVFLSGGLDSSTVAAIAARHKTRIDTFSMGFRSGAHDESPYAQEVARRIGSTHHHFYFDEDSFLTLLPKVADALDEPLGDQALLPLYWLVQEAKRSVKVVLSGEGADEIFGGYGYYGLFIGRNTLPDRIKSLLKFGKISLKTAVFDRIMENTLPVTPSGFPLLMDRAERERVLTEYVVGEAFEKELSAMLSGTEGLQKATLADLLTWLPDDLLVKFDRMTMAHSLEGRAPYLSPGVVEMGINLPPQLRMDANQRKIFLSGVSRRWIPESISQRRKQGFVLPMKSWVAQWMKENDGIRNYLKSSFFPFLESGSLASLLEDDIRKGLKRERLWFATIMLIEWHKRYKAKVRQCRQQWKTALT